VSEPPLPPPGKDWQSPEVGEAIRIILDVFESIGMPQDEVQKRMGRLGDLVRGPPEITVAAYSAILHSALALPALFPTSVDQIPEVRRQIEQQVYRDIDQMPPPR
jgi:hypothetical protein